MEGLMHDRAHLLDAPDLKVEKPKGGWRWAGQEGGVGTSTRRPGALVREAAYGQQLLKAQEQVVVRLWMLRRQNEKSQATLQQGVEGQGHTKEGTGPWFQNRPIPNKEGGRPHSLHRWGAPIPPTRAMGEELYVNGASGG